jgi:hypothetical protein
MKKALLIAVGLIFVATATVNAQDEKKKAPLTDEQKKLQKEMTDKYDKNKDGKLDKEERGAMSAEDKKKMADAGIGGGKKKDK